MNTNIKKKGRMAMAWLIIVAMVIATMSTPFALAKPADPVDPDEYLTDVIFSDYVGNIGEDEIESTTVPATADFIFIKQKSEEHDASYLWTPMEITNDDLKHDILLYLKQNDDSLKGYSDEYWENFDNFIWGYDDEDAMYQFSLEEIDGMDYIVITWTPGTISHIDFGSYEFPEYSVEVTKAVTLNGEATTLLDTTFYFALFDDEDQMIGEKQEVEVEDGVALNKAKFTVDDPEETYYIYEVDAEGKILLSGTDVEGYYLASITNQGSSVTQYPATITVTNNLIDMGQISVTKEVELTGDILTPVNGTFYAGLFTMENDEYVLVMLGDEKAIAALKVEDSEPVTDTETFVGLDLNETYYVFETDEDGVIIDVDEDGYIEPKSTTGWYALAYDENEITLDPENLTGAATITNYFADFEAPFDPSVKVIKTVTVNNKPTASNLTFYAGLFEDKELTKLIAFKPLEMKGTPTAEAAFAFYGDGVTPLKAGTTYYVAETNAQGVPLAGTAKELGFEITINSVSGNNAAVELIEEEAIVNIVNNFTKEEFPLTGDNSNMNLWLFLAMLGVAGAIAPFAFRKKEVAND
jgi:hypothetical protein